MPIKLSRRKLINLALQGGGSHGAFTWGVLDRLLEDGRLDFDGVSGASAGAMNAVLLAHGLTVDGRDGARQALASFWGAVGAKSLFDPWAANVFETLSEIHNSEPSPFLKTLLALTRFFSPYELNPLDLNPLRDIVTEQINFERLRRECAVKLFVATTQMRTGKLRIFETRELTADMLLASACLPSLHQGVEIEGEEYWDGGYSANPAIYPLLYQCRAQDIIMVLLHPLSRPRKPRTAQEIWGRVTELSFSSPFLREMQLITQAKERAEGALLVFGALERRLRNTNFHVIEADDLMTQLSPHSQVNALQPFLEFLRDQGRERAGAWLDRHYNNVAVRSSAKLKELFS